MNILFVILITDKESYHIEIKSELSTNYIICEITKDSFETCLVKHSCIKVFDKTENDINVKKYKPQTNVP